MSIYYLKGKITKIFSKAIVLENAGIGYLLLTNNPSAYSLDEERTFYTYEYIFEEKKTLIGLDNEDEYKIFTKLLSVKGIGPIKALSLLNKFDSNYLKQLIVEGDVSRFASLTHIGPESSKRIISSLKTNLKRKEKIAKRDQRVLDVMTSLRNLGFDEKTIEASMSKFFSSPKDESTMFKEAMFYIKKENK